MENTFPPKNVFMNIPVHVFSTKCEITQLQIILVILTDGKEFYPTVVIFQVANTGSMNKTRLVDNILLKIYVKWT